MQKQSMHIKCKNNFYSNLCIWSKQPCTIKTVIYNDIFTSLRCKKVQSPAKKFKELFSLCPNHFQEWNFCLRGLTIFVFNFGMELLERCVKLNRLTILISLAIPFSKHHFSKPTTKKQCLL